MKRRKSFLFPCYHPSLRKIDVLPFDRLPMDRSCDQYNKQYGIGRVGKESGSCIPDLVPRLVHM